jgi:alkylation response protein AidB-like acyl-CoA dehydrogenase
VREQQARWLRPFVTGELITAIAMTEPAAGSDLQGLRTAARRDGDDWILSGSKAFVTNGISADLVLVVTRTDPSAGARGFSLLAVERGMPGFERGRNLAKAGRRRGRRLRPSHGQLPQERLSIAVVAVAAARRTFELTLDYCKGRTAFGRPIGSFQHNRFVLAEMATEIEIAEHYLAKSVLEHKPAATPCRTRRWPSGGAKRVIDQCVQCEGDSWRLARRLTAEVSAAVPTGSSAAADERVRPARPATS